MEHVIDVGDAANESVLTETGEGGLFGRALLADEPLAAYLDDAETPRYVLRNKKSGVAVEGPEGSGEMRPGSDYSGLALVTDVRVLFAIGDATATDGAADFGEDRTDDEGPGRTDDERPGRADDGDPGRSGRDRTLSVPLGDVVDVRTADGGLLDERFVVETVTDERYAFPCRGDLSPVREFTDAAAGVWARAERHLERAAETVDRMESAFESGDVDVVLAAVGDVEETLSAAREAAGSLDGAATVVADRAAAVRAEVAAFERRAHAERAEQARERAHTRWDDDAYEEAYDHFEAALAAYERAQAVDAGEPTDDLVDRRCERIREEAVRLAESPLDRAEHAAAVAEDADDPATAADWWATAVERYETLVSLDWGRDERRFDGDRERARESLADAARRLVEAHCDRAREALADASDAAADPEVAMAAAERAERALEDAREVARERAPDATEAIEPVAERLRERRAALPEGSLPAADADGGVVTDRTTPIVDPGRGSSPAAPVSEPGTRDATASEPADGDDEAGDTASDETSDGEHPGRGEETATGRFDPRAVDGEAFTSLVAALFRDHGWSTTVFAAGTDRQYDLLAETGGPVDVTVSVWTVHPESVEAVDAATVERHAAYVQRADEADVAAVVSAAPLSGTARERAAAHGIDVLDADDVAEAVAASDLSPEDVVEDHGA